MKQMDDKRFYVYEWYIIDTNEVFYVGKGTGNRYKQIKGRNRYFQCMFSSHNCNVRKIQDGLNEIDAFNLEIETIKYYRENTDYRLTNQTDGGEGTSGWVPSEDFRNKQSYIHKCQWEDESFRDKMLSIRQDEDGVYKSNEFRNKISELVRGSDNPNYQNHWTEEQKDHLRQKQKSNPLYAGETNPNAKRVICVETGEVFNCIKFAKEKYNIKSDGSITVALKNPIRTAGGVHWADYSDDFLNANYRFNYLICVLKQSATIQAIICLDDLSLYQSKTILAKHLNVTVSKITWQLQNNQKFIYKDKTYILVKNYEVALYSDI